MKSVFRVYTCPKCANIGYVDVPNRSVQSKCSFCNQIIIHERSMVYTNTVDEAEECIEELVSEGEIRCRQKNPVPRFGKKRRIKDMVEGLIRMNRGRPVTIQAILSECVQAGIKQERTVHFLNILEDEGSIIKSEGRISMEEKVAV